MKQIIAKAIGEANKRKYFFTKYRDDIISYFIENKKVNINNNIINEEQKKPPLILNSSIHNFKLLYPRDFFTITSREHEKT